MGSRNFYAGVIRIGIRANPYAGFHAPAARSAALFTGAPRAE